MRYPAIAKLGTIVGIWAHPDDESWCAGGLLAGAIVNGQQVASISATKGEAGQYDKMRWQGELGELRAKELDNALSALGITDHRSLGYPDGDCATINDNQAVTAIASILQELQPDTIVTFGADGLTGHPDHQAVSRWTTAAVQHAKLKKPVTILHKIESTEWYERIGKTIDQKFNLYFMTDKPTMLSEAQIDLALHLAPELVEHKLAALRAHTTQTEKIFAELSPADLQAFAEFEGFTIVQNL